MYNMVNHVNNNTRYRDYNAKMRRNISTGYTRCEVIEDIADILNNIEDRFIYKIDNILTGDAIADTITKVNNIINNAMAKVVNKLKFVIFLHNAISKEDIVISIAKIIGVNMQKLQSSLEDALSLTSLLMELLSTLSLILILIFSI